MLINELYLNDKSLPDKDEVAFNIFSVLNKYYLAGIQGLRPNFKMQNISDQHTWNSVNNMYFEIIKVYY